MARKRLIRDDKDEDESIEAFEMSDLEEAEIGGLRSYGRSSRCC